MRPRTLVVAHREALAAEAIATALGSDPSIVPIGATGSIPELERLSARADVAAIDERLRGAREAAARLRRRGIRVVLVGERTGGEDEGVKVPTWGRVADLLAALAPSDRPARRMRLSPQQHRVLSLVARGLTARQVGRQLGISAKTVEQHKTRIFAKLGVPNQAAAVAAVRDLDGGVR